MEFKAKAKEAKVGTQIESDGEAKAERDHAAWGIKFLGLVPLGHTFINYKNPLTHKLLILLK